VATMLRWSTRHRAKEYVRLSQCSTHCAPYKHFTDDEAIEHRRQITADHPNLPARADKVFRKISGLIRPDGMIAYLRQHDHGGHRYRTSALARPEIDVDKLASTLLEVAEASRSRTKRPEEAA
jgi:hypothetical protein